MQLRGVVVRVAAQVFSSRMVMVFQDFGNEMNTVLIVPMLSNFELSCCYTSLTLEALIVEEEHHHHGAPSFPQGVAHCLF